jgi:hypothetical protein
MPRRKSHFDVYMFLTHAIWYCQWGPGTSDRVDLTEADLQAAKILTDLRSKVARENGI